MAVSAPTLLGSYASSANVTSGSTAVPATSVGTFVLVAMTGSTATTTFTITDSQSNTWTQAVSGSNSGALPLAGAYAWTFLTTAWTSTDTITVTRSGLAGILAFTAEGFTGVATGTPISATASGNAGGTAGTSASTSSALTPNTSDAVHALLGVNGSATSIAYSAPLSLDQTITTTGTARKLVTGFEQVASGGSVTPATSWTTSSQWMMLGVVLAAAASTPSVTAALTGTGAYSAATKPVVPVTAALTGAGTFSATASIASTTPAAGGLPTVQVLLDNGTGTFPYDITGYVRLADGLSIQRGRQDEFSQVSPATLALTLENTDGRFTFGSTTYASGIFVDQQIRVIETVSGTTSTRFTGYVQSWPTAWPDGGDTYATAQIVATDQMARLARRQMNSVTEYETQRVANILYPLTEASGSTAAAPRPTFYYAPILQSVGSGNPVTFGQSIPIPDNLSGAGFGAGQWLSAPVSFGYSGMSVCCLFVSETLPAATTSIVAVGQFSINLLTSGQAQAAGDRGSVSGGPNICDGKAHHLAVVNDRVDDYLFLFVDGVQVNVGYSSTALNPDSLDVGSAGLTGTVGMVAIIESVAHDTDIATLSQAALTGFAGERSDQRVTRLAGYANVASLALETGVQTSTPAQTITGGAALDAMQTVSTSEGGLLFVRGDGALTFQNRYHRPSQVTPDWTITNDDLDTGTTFTVDTQGLTNHVVAKSITGAEQTADNTASIAAHDQYPTSLDLLVTTDAEALDRAQWLVTTNGVPAPRLGAVTVDLLTQPVAKQQAALGLELSDWLRITGLPSQTPGGTQANLVIEGWSEALSKDTWTLTFNATSQTPYRAAVVDTSTATCDTGSPVYY